MFTKFLRAGNLFDYLKGPRDSMNQPREQDAEILRGNSEVATALLKAQAPPHLSMDRRWWTRHCEDHLTHIINCFSEKQDEVEKALPKVIQGTEALLLAGLPADSLQFVWYEHPQEIGAHTHGGMIRSLLPSGGHYNPCLSFKLAQHFDRLASRHFKLSDQLDPDRARLVLGAWASWKPKKKGDIRKVIDETDTAWVNGKIQKHSDFLDLLEKDLGFEILAVPGPQGPRQLKKPKSQQHLRLYQHTVAIETSTSGVIYFRGPVCRPEFTAQAWREKLEVFRCEHERLLQKPNQVYFSFVHLLNERIAFQRQTYKNLPKSEFPCVGLADFAWLNPANDQSWHELESSQSRSESMDSAAAVMTHAAIPIPSLNPREASKQDQMASTALSLDLTFPFVCDVQSLDDLTDPMVQILAEELAPDDFDDLPTDDEELNEQENASPETVVITTSPEPSGASAGSDLSLSSGGGIDSGGGSSSQATQPSDNSEPPVMPAEQHTSQESNSADIDEKRRKQKQKQVQRQKKKLRALMLRICVNQARHLEVEFERQKIATPSPSGVNPAPQTKPEAKATGRPEIPKETKPETKPPPRTTPTLRTTPTPTPRQTQTPGPDMDF